MNTWIKANDYQLIYDHLLACVQQEHPQQVIERFRALFIMGYTYPDRHVQEAMDRIVTSSNASQNFRPFVNRCCHILINRWQSRPLLQGAVPDFLAVLETQVSMPAAGLSRAPIVRKLRLLLKDYLDSEAFQKLQRMVQFLREDAQDASQIRKNSDRPLSTLIRRYPYLYNHCLVGDETSPEELRHIQHYQHQAVQQFELNLSQYLTSEFRRAQGHVNTPTVKNPTLLTPEELKASVQHFVGKLDQQHTYRDLANQFEQRLQRLKSTRDFRDAFFHYLTDTIPDVGRGRFRQKFHQYLDTLPAFQQPQPVNEFTIVRTCSQTLNYLVVDSAQNPNHLVFIDLLNNIGTAATIGLLLKVVLVSKKVKPYLEKRFAILFNHYQSFSRGKVRWLVNCLEHFNIANVTHFGKRDFSFFGRY
ncbi:hypothetical protein L5220_04770 [Synechococcus sp. PCC 6716]|nr:hypothetical protein [Synechococcus sp. PCC 6716]